MRRILSVLLENESGALSRVVGLFSQRGYNIESLTVAPTDDATLSRMTIQTKGDAQVLEQIEKQLHKLVDVLRVSELVPGAHVEREIMLVKLRASGYGRGIRPTNRAYQLFGPVRQALQIVRNELPGARFKPESSERLFHISITSPVDILLTAKLFKQIKQYAPRVQVNFDSLVNEQIERKLRYQESDFLIDYQDLPGDEFCCEALFEDKFVLAVAQAHPRIGAECTLRNLLLESHAVVSINQFSSVSRFFYAHTDLFRQMAYQGTDLSSVLSMVSKTEMVAIAPSWMVEQYADYLKIRAVTLVDIETRRTCFFNWHRASERDSAHVWLHQLMSEFGQRYRG